MIATMVSVVAPASTRSSLCWSRARSKLRATLSSSSSSVSCVAVKVIVFDVSPALNVTLAGTE